MTNAAFPLHRADIAKIMADSTPAKIVNQFTKIARNFQVQQTDLDSMIDVQRENIEALVARHKEILHKALIEATEAVSELSRADGLQEAAAEQAEVLEAPFETNLGNIMEINKLVAKSNAETSEHINARIS